MATAAAAVVATGVELTPEIIVGVETAESAVLPVAGEVLPVAEEGAEVGVKVVKKIAEKVAPKTEATVEEVAKAVKDAAAKKVETESQIWGRLKDAATGWSFAKMTSGKKENDKTDFEKPPTPIIGKPPTAITVRGASQDKSPLKMALAIVLIIIVIAIIAAVTKARSGFIMTFGAITGATVLLTLATHILLRV